MNPPTPDPRSAANSFDSPGSSGTRAPRLFPRPFPPRPRPPLGWLVAFLGLVGIPATFTLPAPAQTAFSLGSGPLDLAVPDGSLEGLQHTLTVSTPMNRVLETRISIQLDSLPGGSFAGDLYLTVVHDGHAAVLLNRPGRQPGRPFGYGDSANLTITFDDTAATADIHAYRVSMTGSDATPLAGGLSSLSGLWQSDGRRSDPLAVSLSDPRPARLDEFVGTNPNGNWTLFVADLGGGGTVAVRQWSVDLVAVPEPETIAFATALALGAWICRRGARQKSDLPPRRLAPWAGPATLVALAASFALLVAPPSVHAATPNALPFQGRVSVDGIPFSGTGHFRFALVDATDAVRWSSAPDNSPADGQPDTATSLPVNKGLYAVQLGAGMEPIPPDLFSAHDELRLRVWFDDGVHGVQLLNPDQPLAAVPYARHSASADLAQSAVSAQSAQTAQSAVTVTGPVPAAQVTGALTLNQLPDTVARLDSSPTFTGTIRAAGFEGAGAVPWIPTSAAAVSARPNTGILATREEGPVVVTLPDQAQPGDVVRVSGAGLGGWTAVVPPGQRWKDAIRGAAWTPVGDTRAWRSIVMSADGRQLAAVAANAPIALSADSGKTWTARGPSLPWSSIVASADGTRLAAAARGGSLWTSGDSGVNWTDRARTGDWKQLAGSADGLRLIAMEGTGSLWNSADGGQTWTRRTALGEPWVAVASSADGQRAIAGAPRDGSGFSAGAHVTTSEDSGNTWNYRRTFDSSGYSGCVLGMSADGPGLFVGVVGSYFQVSTDLGVTWDLRGPSGVWSSMASSADGTRWIAGTATEGVLVFSDTGRVWTSHPITTRSTAVASSADGLILAAAVDGGPIFVSLPEQRGPAGAFAEFQYVGDGWWRSTTPAVLDSQGKTALTVVPDLPASRITSGVLDQDRIPSLPASMITSGTLSLDRIPNLPASRITSGTFNPSRLPTNLPGIRTFDGPVGIGGHHALAAPLGIRADSANASFGYCLSLHDRDNTPIWKLGVDTGNQFSLGAAGLRDYDLCIHRTSGNVGIGATPYDNRKLRVAGNLSVDGEGHFDGDGRFGGTVYCDALDFFSDERLKTHVAPLTDSLARIEALRGIGFEWRTDASRRIGSPGRQLGFLAQEVATVLPDLVHTNTDGFLSVNYNGVTPVLVEAVKELHHEVGTRLADQAAALAAKDAEIRELRDRLARIEATLGTRSGR